MKKEELEYKLKEAESKLKDLEHLAEAVETKDIEISRLIRSLKETTDRLLEAESNLKKLEHLGESVETKDKEILRLSKSLKQATDQLQEQVHLAQSVESKDKEIQKLKTDRAEDVASVKNEMARRITVLELENQNLRERLSSLPDVDKLKEVLDKLTSDNKKLTSFVNQHIRAFRNYLKTQQASLDNTIELEALISEQLDIK